MRRLFFNIFLFLILSAFLGNASADGGENKKIHVAAEHESNPEVIKQLIKDGADLNEMGLEGLTPLMLAAAYNPHAEILEALISEGASLISTDEMGRSPLMLAAALNSEPAVTASLLRHGAPVKTRDNTGRTALWFAASRRNEQIAELLIDAGAPVDEPDNDGITPLLAACERPEFNIINLLIEAGADVNRRGRQRLTPLMRAVAAGADFKTIKAFIDGRADLSAQDDQNRTALFIAASSNNISGDIAALLIAQSPDVRDNNFVTPLMEACRAWNTNTVKILIDNGADASLKDRNGYNALHYAAAFNSPVEIANILINNGADLLSAVNRRGYTPFITAIESGADAEILNLLIKSGAGDETGAWDGITPLMAAALNDNITAAKILIENGADANARDLAGWTVLHFSAARAGAETINLFLSLKLAGAPDIRDSGDTTPLMVAAANDNAQAVKILLDAGANISLQDKTGRDALSYARMRNARNAVKVLEDFKDNNKK